MERIRLSLHREVDDSYDILIGNNLFEKIAIGLTKLKINKIAIITDSNVKKIYGEKFLKLLKKNNLDSRMVAFPAGEKNKTRKNKEKIEDYLIAEGLSRDSLIIALGGGVVGDMAGFVASTFMRGINYIQIPTTILAMVDSSVGGKTAVDTNYGKNLVGTFYQPKKVFIDIDTLSSLPKEEMMNGLAEIIKHAIIADKELFRFIEWNIDSIYAKEQSALIEVIKKSCDIKKSVVERDEMEKSVRKLLNFGHTIGHAIEKTNNYTIKHGAGVAIGMIVETQIAKEMDLIDLHDVERIKSVIKKAGFDLKLPGTPKKEIIDNVKFDKKKFLGHVKFTLPLKIGKAGIDYDVDDHIINKALGVLK